MTQKERLEFAAQEEVNKKVRAELKEQTQLADIGELAGQVTHKFNNFLNSLLLKIALLESELPELIAAKFADVKQQAHHMAEVIKQVHQFRRRQPGAKPVDLNLLLKKIADSMTQEASGAMSIQLALSSESALVVISPIDFERLCSFLVRNRLSESGSPGGTLILRTAAGKEKVRFSLEDTRPIVPASLLANFFDADAKGLEGANKLELAACKALARRYQGRIQATHTAGGGLLIDADFPKAVDSEGGL
jgi:C4-dicarboxylate-specific signal transduction histidine kinase